MVTGLLESPTYQSMSQNQWPRLSEAKGWTLTHRPAIDAVWLCASCPCPAVAPGEEKSKEKAKERGKKIEEECNPPAWLRNTGWREESDISPLLTAPPHPPHLNPSPGPIMHSRNASDILNQLGRCQKRQTPIKVRVRVKLEVACWVTQGKWCTMTFMR